MLISVVISTVSRERSPLLMRLIQSLNDQTDQGFEGIIIVDENPSLAEDLTKWLADRQNWRVYANPNDRGLAHSRNIGMALAKGDVIAFIDDDAVASADWLRTIREIFSDKDVGAATGHIFPDWEHEWMDWFPHELFWMISCSYNVTPKERCEIDRGFGVDMAFSKKALSQVGGFDERFGIKKGQWIGGEDTELFLRVREVQYKVVFEPNMWVLHHVPSKRLSMGKLAKRAVAQGQGSYYMRHHTNLKVSKYSGKSYLDSLFKEFVPHTLKGIASRNFALHLRRMFTVGSVTMLILAGMIKGAMNKPQVSAVPGIFRVPDLTPVDPIKKD